MRDRIRGTLIGLLATPVLVVVLAACGSSSSTSASAGSSAGAQALLTATFSGAHSVKSGVLGFDLTVTPSGSNTLKGPISLGINGPFQTRGPGKLPESDLSISIDALGHHGALGIVSTGSAGYITLKGAAYQLPAAQYAKLASSLATASAGTGTGGLAKFGIKPLHWLTAPTIIGSDSVAGAPTTHIRAKVNVSALLDDLSTFLGRAAASGATGTTTLPSSLSAATRQKIASEIRNPTVDLWTGVSDHTLRKLAIALDVPVSGSISSLLGGLSSAQFQLTLQYGNLNQPQTVATPSNVRPFSQFTSQIRGILSAIQGTLGAGGAGTATSGSGSSAAGVQKYSQCIQQASGDVTKMQKCASLLSAG